MNDHLMLRQLPKPRMKLMKMRLGTDYGSLPLIPKSLLLSAKRKTAEERRVSEKGSGIGSGPRIDALPRSWSLT
jgi:hypothetical protein